eukprot:822184-Pelagomonas_calceolata.AAC.1
MSGSSLADNSTSQDMREDPRMLSSMKHERNEVIPNAYHNDKAPTSKARAGSAGYQVLSDNEREPELLLCFCNESSLCDYILDCQGAKVLPHLKWELELLHGLGYEQLMA